jgi:hypothetical protein
MFGGFGSAALMTEASAADVADGTAAVAAVLDDESLEPGAFTLTAFTAGGTAPMAFTFGCVLLVAAPLSSADAMAGTISEIVATATVNATNGARGGLFADSTVISLKST